MSESVQEKVDRIRNGLLRAVFTEAEPLQQFTRAELEAMIAPVVALMAEGEPADLLAVTREVARGG